MAVVVPSLASAKRVRNGLIAYAPPRGEEEPNSIWTIKSDGSGNRRLLGANSDFHGGPSGPRWSRDGTKLLFFRGANRDIPDNGSLWYLTVATRRLRQVPLPTDRGVISGYDWAPDGRHLVVSLRRDWDKAVLYTLRVGGTHLKRLRPGLYPSWSGDGRHIVFSLMTRRIDNTLASTVNVVRPNGTGFLQLSAPSEDDAWSPSFSPGGTKVIYADTYRPPPPAPCCVPEWRTVDVTGANDTLVRAAPGPATYWDAPQWTPDGRRLAITRTDQLNMPGVPPRTTLVTFNLSGQDEREVFTLPPDTFSGVKFSWQRAR
jgi:Tol biopolymer transport system component